MMLLLLFGRIVESISSRSVRGARELKTCFGRRLNEEEALELVPLLNVGEWD